MIILVDMDNVIADYDAMLGELIAKRFPYIKLISPDRRTSFSLFREYPGYEDKIINLALEKGFFLSLRPVEGAISGLNRLLDLGFDVRICTCPVAKSAYCLNEKYLWVKKYLPNFSKRLIITNDKTLIRGDILIDDRPVIEGFIKPEWLHILYSRPYNLDLPGPRTNWDNLEKFLSKEYSAWLKPTD